MSQSTPSGRRDALRAVQDQAEVREALLEHMPDHEWATSPLDPAERTPGA